MGIEVDDVKAAGAVLAVGWIGAGKMGTPMIRNLLAQDIPVAVTDPVAQAVAELAGVGATVAADASRHRSSDIVFATLPNDAVLRHVVFGDETSPGLADVLRPGAIFVEMSTVSPDCSSEVAAALKSRNIHYLRAPLSGSTALAEKAALTVLASGDKAAWDTVEPYLAHLSARRFYLGGGEEARYMKLVLNTLVGATSAIMAEALALGESGGLNRRAMMDVVGESAVASPLLAYKADAIVADDFTPAFSVEQMIKDFILITDAAHAHDVPQAVTSLILEQYRDAAKAGLNDDDFFALVKWRGGKAKL
ncbi:3-hydroxyisobutyrate dehydrogenase [Loktanella sp. DSM 29012]|uniref:NAD(P)-dependent oxidoreductase n=1 Tax=Loktanella sp. DSM 29012 TaxID=1881056 RepID=UPI0008C0B41B|nr:NAD(P)-dependent oxidoreductase [Loktanella sp. DSM 29012]SEQ75058.1 3-hydroxyisobutyrate dehydrogenase [Loktanella sp. DSM 29012]